MDMLFTIILPLLGGVAIFIYGMNLMSAGLEKLAGSKLEYILERLTRNLFTALLLGMLVTAVIQSSSATTVMVVGFVNARMMKLKQAVGVIMGANIGTCVTSLLLGLGDIDSKSGVLALIKPTSFAPVLLVIGVVLLMTAKRGFKRDLAGILLGFGILFTGMHLMEIAAAPLKDNEGFRNLFTMFTNPLLGIAVGALVTAIIQSSSASIGILQSFSSLGIIPFSAAAPIIMGQNIGTCATAMLSSIGANRNAKRAALVHLYFNLIGTGVFIALLYALHSIITLPFWNDSVNRTGIAMFHLVFNLVNTVVLLPFTGLLVKLAKLTLPSSEDKRAESSLLDERFLTTPSLALDRARATTVDMSLLAMDNYHSAVSLLWDYDEKKYRKLMENEALMDRYEVKIGQYLLKLNNHELSYEETRMVNELLRSVGDMERIGDYAVNVAEQAADKHSAFVGFSDSANRELVLITDAVEELLDITCQCYSQKDAELAANIEPLEQTVDMMTSELKERHIARLQQGRCTAETGALYLELLINLERIADHCSNLGVAVVQGYGLGHQGSIFDTHEYIRKLHAGGDKVYDRVYAQYTEKYVGAMEKITL